MPNQLAKTGGYKTLVNQIQAELSDLDFFVRRRTAETYWKIGKSLYEHLLKSRDRAGYGHNFYERLAEDVNRDATTLARMVQFYRAFPILADQQELSWHHYKSLITIPDESKRNFFARQAAKKGWTYEELSESIRLDKLKYEEPCTRTVQGKPKTVLSVTRSRLFTYKILEPGYIHPIDEQLIIDLGFNFLIHTEIKNLRLKEGEIIESVKEGDNYSFKRSLAKPKELYTYKALVERVVDADTLWLNIDLGFSSWSRQKVRLRGIDAPELSTKEGIEAKKFVEARLKEVEFVIVKTYKSDKFDRYLADIFYLKDEKEAQKVLEEGVFLNQQLLDLNLAQVWME